MITRFRPVHPQRGLHDNRRYALYYQVELMPFGGLMVGALRKCNAIIGGETIVESDPPVLDLRDLIYVPFHDPASQAGVFDHGQKMVLQAWYFRGPEPLRATPYLGTPYVPAMVPDLAPDSHYVYGGWLHEHYGHFLLSSLCRFWIPLFADRTVKVLVHSPISIAEWFAIPWAAAIFIAFDITPDRLVSFNHPTRISALVVPGPAFQEDNFTHRAFATALNTLGRQIAGDRIAKVPNSHPIYLSKEKLRHGVQTLVNENEITAILLREGIEVVYPEQLPFADQVALWFNHTHLASLASSALHTSILAPGRDLTVLSCVDSLRSSYVLLDRVNRATARYLQPAADEIENLGPRDGFSSAYLARRPEVIAADLLRAFDFSQRSAASRAGVPVWPRTGFWRPKEADFTESGLVNVALDRPARQSSVHPWTLPDSGCTTGGALTGEFGFHTDHELGAWWEVDLGVERLVERVRLFNRADTAQERCSRFVISLSRADGCLSAEHRQEQAAHFGGLDAAPFLWVLPRPAPAINVRITLLDSDYLHLDQVEVLASLLPREAPPRPRFS